MSKKIQTIEVQNIAISISKVKDDDFICLTDMAKGKEGDARAADIIKNWIRNRSTLEFVGTWEQMYNPNFKVVEFDHFKMQAGLPSFVLSPRQSYQLNILNDTDFFRSLKKSNDKVYLNPTIKKLGDGK